MPPVAMIAVAAFGAISAGAAIAGAIGVTAFLGMSVATWAAIGAVGMLVSGLALAATMPKPKTPESAGQQLNMKLSADNALPVAYGRTATGGSIYYRDTSGRSNKTLAMLVALSVGGAIGGVSEVRANDYQLSLSGAYSGGKQTTIAAIGDTASKSKMFKKNSLHFWHLNGADPQPQTFAQVSGLPIPADRASGVATAIIQADYDQEVFPQGLPKFTWVVNGQRVYDPRKDSTYPGGSGSHRIDNPATWEWSQNPHLCALNWTLGRWSGGKKLFGIGAPPEEVDIPAFVAGANIADALGWTVGGVAQTTDDKFSVLGTLLQAGGAIPLVRGAQISVLTYTVKPSIYTITKDDVVGSASVMNTAPHRDRKNRITPTYREESQFWNLVPGEAVSAAQYVAEDSGEVRSSEINLPFVQKASQAHQLATYDLVNTREFLTFEITAKPKLLAVRVGDCVTVTLPDIAVNNQKCMVVQRDFDPNTFQVKLTLRSETDAKHAFALGQSQVAPPSPSLSTFDPSNPDGPGEGSWVISDTSILNDAGAQQPALVVSGANDDPTTQAVIVEIRRSGETEWTAPREGPSSSTQFIVTDVVADTDYEVAVSYRTVLGIVSERMVIGPVTAGAQLAGGVRPGGIGWNPNDPNSPIIGVPPVLTDLDENGHIDGGMVNAGDGLTVLERFTAFGEELAAANETIANAQAMVDGVPGQIAAVADQAEADLAAARTNLQGQIDGIPALITAGDATLQSAIADANTTINTNRTNAETAIAGVNSQITLVNPAAGTLGRRFITAETMTASTVTKVSALETVVGTSANEAGTLRGRVYNLEQSSSEGSTVTAQRIAGLEASVGLNANEGLRARMATVEVATTDGRFATSTRVNDLEARLGAGNGTSVTARLSTVETATTDGRFATASRATALEATVNNPTGGVANLGARMATVETATTDGRFATAQRVTNLEATVNAANGGNANLLARIGVVETATTDGRFASATRVTALEASSKSFPNLLKNGDFTRGVNDWGKDQAGTFDRYYHTTLGSIGYFNGAEYVYTATIPAEPNNAYSLSFEGERGGGNGYAQIQWLPSYAASAAVALPNDWGTRAKLENIIAPAGTTGLRVVFYRGTAALVHMSRVKVNNGVVATNWSDEGSVTDTNARLGVVETATTDGRFATASRVSALEATVNAADGGNANLKARLGTVETATTDGRFATATRVTALEAANRSSANRIKNPDFKNGFSHWERDGAGPASDSGFYYHATLGSIAWIKGAVGYMCSEFYPCSPGDVFSFSFEGDWGGGNGNASLQWLPGYAQVGHVNIPSTWGVRAKSENITAPAGTTGVRIVIGKGNATQIHATRVKLNYGPVATNYSDEATDYDTNARLGVVETATTDGRFATASRVTDLEATVNTGPNRNGQLAARITLVETATTDGRFATASRVQSLEAAVGAGNGTPVTSRITTVETATTDGRFASATRVGLLEARGTDAINRNGNFAVDFGNGAIPSGWSDWSGAANNTTRVNGVASNNAVRFTTAAGQDRGISQTVQSISTGWYVLEGTVTLESGSLLGSGILVQFFNSGGTEIDNAQLRFAEQPDISGNVQGAGSAGKTYRYSFLKNASAAGITQANIYAMAGWSGFGTIAAKTMTFHEAKIRQASSAEIAVGVATPAGSNLNARIGLIETATTDGRFATAQRASDLEATVNTGPNRNGQLAARITVVETATTDGRFATSTRVNDLQATLQTRNNLCPNGGLENQLVGMTSSHTLAYANSGWGPCAMVYNSGSATVTINFPRFSVYGGNYYTISGDTVCFGSSGQIAYLDIIFFDANGAVCADGPEKPIYGQHDFTNGTGRLQDHAIHTLAPSNAVQAQARAVFGGNGITDCGVRRVKVEMGQTPATPYTPEASGVQTSARLTTVETATTDGRFATASSVTSLTARVNSQGGNLLINTDFESGTGGWSPGGQVVAPLVVNPAGDPWHPVGENVVGFNVVGSAGYSDISSDRVSVEGGKWYDLSAYIATHRANVNMYIGWFNAAGANLGYPDGPGEFVPASGGQSLNQFTRRWFKAQAPSDAAFAIVIFRKLATNSGGDSWLWLCRPMFGECSASTTEPRPFTHGNARNLAGQILSANNVTADLRGRVQATAGLTVQAGNRVAGMRFHATDGTDQNYSSIDFLADTFRVWSPDQNTGIPPFEVRNGGVRMKSAFVDRLSVGTSITLGSGIQFKVAVQPIDINVTDGQSINFGYDLGANPSLTFAGNNLAPLNAGETYNLYAENLSPTGFIARLKISTPASPANLATGWLGANANGPTSHHMYIDQYGGRSTTGGYNVRVNGYNRIYRMRQFNQPNQPEYVYDDPYEQVQGETWITVYGWNGGAWVELDTIWIGPNWTSANGYQDQYFDVTQTVPTGTNISHIGVAVTYETYAQSYVANLAVDWQTQGSGGGLRSATPNGQVSAVTIRPKS